MTEIYNVGNLPLHLQVMAKEVMGQRSTRFFEMSNATELFNHAKDGNCEEATVTIDTENERGFVIAFSFNESQLEDLSGDKLITMNIFFAELDSGETRLYRNMLHQHRQDQEDNMAERNAKKKLKEFEIKGVIDE